MQKEWKKSIVYDGRLCAVRVSAGEISTGEKFKQRPLRELLYDAACGIFKRFPELDELAMYFFESKNLLHYNNFFGCMNYGLDFNEKTLREHPELVMKQEGQSYPI